ncbi:hypothetical protein SporoP37_02435 [Sporosarcina sp. P37]|uniref:helix-turn-helix domain-containing protein n=1 Tax=unclassified Sporosarcina TaxID=2647733 RepID=UPI000A17A952|nr:MULTISPECIES: helix-turn-helix transcriptional regulator [unclassified Sporosarcina]ARK23659.1 hypothetical protein SporoP37_02435 [Sporosarcina sp. P37]PID18716.1 XRE family transcriptional regulator [Sporosarcina sp. P35]
MSLMLIRIARHFSGLSQKELAELIGQSQNAVSRYELGTLSVSPKTERKLKQAFESAGIGQDELDFLQGVIASNKK